MSQFASEMVDRVTEARVSLDEAHAEGDDYLVHVRIGELESLARVAADHDFEVPGLQETLDRHTGPIDLTLPQTAWAGPSTDATELPA